jgi:hypothetical protein
MKPQIGVEYFRFEEDFMEDNIRCIPMIVRFKLDACGIKLKLREWSQMTMAERQQLAEQPIESHTEKENYRNGLRQLIYQRTREEPTPLAIDPSPAWAITDELPMSIQLKLKETNLQLTLEQWKGLSTLQRFALSKLTRPGHENKNFPKAIKEFGLV